MKFKSCMDFIVQSEDEVPKNWPGSIMMANNSSFLLAGDSKIAIMSAKNVIIIIT